MTMKRFIPLALLAFSAPLAAETIDLLQAYKFARQTDQGYHAAEAARNAVAARLPQARAALLPQLSLSASGNRVFAEIENEQLFALSQTHSTTGQTLFNSTTPVIVENDSIRDFRNASLQLFQPIFRWNLWLNLGSAELELAQAEAQRTLAEQELMYNVAIWYFNLLSARDTLALASNEKAAIASQLEQSKARFEVGLTPITDMQEAQARYDLTDAQEILARQEFEDTQDIFYGLIEFKFTDLASIQNTIALTPPEPANMDEWMTGAQNNNLSLKIAQLNHQLAQRNIRIARSGHLPTLDLVGSYSYDNNSDNNITPIGQEQFIASDGTPVTEITRITASDSTVISKSIGLQLNLPIFSGGAVSAQTTEAIHRETQAKQLLGAELESTNRQIRSAYRGVLTAIQRVRALEQAVRSNQSSFDAVEAGYEVGDRTSVDVLNARHSLYSARRDYTQARYDYLLELLRLRFIAGILNESDIANINQWLEQPTAKHSNAVIANTVTTAEPATAATSVIPLTAAAEQSTEKPLAVATTTAAPASTAPVAASSPSVAEANTPIATATQPRWLYLSTALRISPPAQAPKRRPRRR